MKGRLAVLSGKEQIEIKEFELSKPGFKEMLVEITCANVCGSELHVWKGLHPFKKYGGGIGHEFAAKILELGEGVETDYAGKPVKIGDRIVAAYYITCQKCAPCLRGDFYLCKNRDVFMSKLPEEHPHFFGAMATHCYIFPNQYFYKIPDTVPDAVAAGANCALSQVIFAIEKAGGLKGGETFLVQGAGGLGLNATAVAKELGAYVIVIDGVKERLEMAKRFGADCTIDMNEYPTVESRVKAINELTNGEGVDAALEVTGVGPAFAEGIELIRVGGRYLVLGNVLPVLKVEFSLGLLVRKCIDVIPACRYNPWYLNKALAFLERNHHKLPYAEMSAKEYSLDEIMEAHRDSENRKVTRAAIIPAL